MLKTLSASIPEKLGEKSNSSFFTFRYPGRESLTIDWLLKSRPELKKFYIYDVCLTTGSLLYSCAGGMGVTKEPYMVEMHKFFKSSSAIYALKSVMTHDLKGAFTRRRFQALKESMNEGEIRSSSLEAQARLYLLWCGSGFKHRYRGTGFDALYHPTLPNYEGLAQASRQSREKNLLFRREDFNSMSDSIINENVVVHLFIPTEFGRYGAGFKWDKNRLGAYVRLINEFHRLGHKVCISALFERRGLVFRDYTSMFPEFSSIVAPGFKVSELTSEPDFSEMHLLNF